MFNCRDCPEEIRERCIQVCSTSPSVKLIMRRAFETEADTEQMWGLLQMNCLIRLQGEQAAKASRQTSLMRRLARKPSPIQIGEVEEKDEETAPPRYCLVLQNGQHRIALPAHGEIVLGRSDPMANVTPDVDLSYEDRESSFISRRHARIVGRNGRHEIEDLGSTNGIKVNGKYLRIGQRVQLRPGDRVTLGHCEFAYSPIPEVHISPHAAPPQAYLRFAFTGHRFLLPSWGEVIVGRRDRAVGFVPDIDLSEEEYAAQIVARRHVKIIARKGRHYVEDLGSANGTKLNGVRIGIGEFCLLNPGDHLWLGGYVLAYDLEL